jgi:Zn-dependent peptidase ImmA (M78 family)
MASAPKTIQLNPGVLKWARERANLSIPELSRALGLPEEVLSKWEDTGEIRFNHIEKLAGKTRTPLGLLYLPVPLDETLPVKDFRTFQGRPPDRPSPELLDTIHSMQRRQEWMREELLSQGSQPLHFVGSVSIEVEPARVANSMRKALNLIDGWATETRSWTDAMLLLRERMDEAGILVVINGIVGNNTHRKLDYKEFRGFALADEYAPLVFVNGADFHAARMFTLAHECAHIWLGQSSISNLTNLTPGGDRTEQWCNQVAAEFLAPTERFREIWNQASPETAIDHVRVHFRISSIVAARRALDLGYITDGEFRRLYLQSEQNAERELARKKESSGPQGDFYMNQKTRVGRRFGEAVVRAVIEDRLLYHDAYELTGLSQDSLDEFANREGIV